MQIIGICRFSYLTSDNSGFQRASKVYCLKRLSERLKIFEALWVPCIKGQKNKNFKIALLVGSGLPAVILDRLRSLVADIQEVELCIEPDGLPHRDICHTIFKRLRDPKSDIVAEFALDDDDGVSINFISEVARIGSMLSPIIHEHGRAELDFSRGYALKFTEGYIFLKEVVEPHWNCGQVIFQKQPTRLSLFHMHHYRFWKKHHCLTISNRPMFIRSYHSTNDSGGAWDRLKSEKSLNPAVGVSKVLRGDFCVSFDSVILDEAAGELENI